MTKQTPTIDLVSEMLKNRSAGTWLTVGAIKARIGRSADSVQGVLHELEAQGVVRSKPDVTMGTINNVSHFSRSRVWQWVRP